NAAAGAGASAGGAAHGARSGRNRRLGRTRHPAHRSACRRARRDRRSGRRAARHGRRSRRRARRRRPLAARPAMTPLQFEAQHAAAWQELGAALAAMARQRGSAPADRARIAALYRVACEHLAIAESRSYPVWLIERLEVLTSRGHQLVYRQTDFGIDKLRRLFGIDFPAAVRAYRLQMLVALL